MSTEGGLPCMQVQVLLQNIHETLSVLMVRGDQAHMITDIRQKLVTMSKLLSSISDAESESVKQALQHKNESKFEQNGDGVPASQ